MGYFNRCQLCGQKIDSQLLDDEEKGWQAVYQELTCLEDGSLPKPATSDTSSEPESLVHSACWKVAEARAKVRTFDRDQLCRFRTLLQDISGLQQLSFAVSPTLSDLESQATPDIKSRPGAMDNCLPNELWDQIYLRLDGLQEVVAFRSTSSVEPGGLTWRNFGTQVFGDTGQHLPVETIKNVLINFHQHRERYPHTANYLTVLHNTDILLSKMEQRFHGTQIEMVDEKFHPLTAGSPGSTHWPMFRIGPDAQLLLLHFARFPDRSYFVGATQSDDSVGYEGDQAVKTDVNSVTGVRVLYDENGILAIQFQTVNGWSHLLGGDSPVRQHWDTRILCSETRGLSRCRIVATFDVWQHSRLSYWWRLTEHIVHQSDISYRFT